jgi:hypothetical protein
MTLTTDRFDRRHALRLLGGAALAIPAGFRLIQPVSAGRAWCRMDPDVLLEGTFVRVDVAVPEEYVPLVNGPT